MCRQGNTQKPASRGIESPGEEGVPEEETNTDQRTRDKARGDRIQWGLGV